MGIESQTFWSWVQHPIHLAIFSHVTNYKARSKFTSLMFARAKQQLHKNNSLLLVIWSLLTCLADTGVDWNGINYIICQLVMIYQHNIVNPLSLNAGGYTVHTLRFCDIEQSGCLHRNNLNMFWWKSCVHWDSKCIDAVSSWATLMKANKLQTGIGLDSVFIWL